MFIMLEIKAEIKNCIVRAGSNLKKVMTALNRNKSITTTYSNIANKINTGTITFNEAQYILDYLGYKFTIERK